MSEYLDALGPDANLGLVFHDLHTKARALIEELDALREEHYGPDSGQKLVPGTQLQMGWMHGQYGAGAGVYKTTQVMALVNGEPNRLLKEGSYSPPVEGDTSEPWVVAGYRGDERHPDYSMHQRTSDMPMAGRISFRLWNLGAKERPEEPIGRAERPATAKVVDLEGVNQVALEFVTQGILDNMTVVELIRDGEPAGEVLEMMSRTAVEL